MQATFIKGVRETTNNFLYGGLNKYAQIGRFAALPVALLETSMMIGTIPLEVIENAALLPINAVGCCFNKKFCLKDMAICLIRVVISPVVIFLIVATSPLAVACQTLNIIIRPRHAQPMTMEVKALSGKIV
ncbi:MAG: hypothetical protein ACSNEK_08910 [Parachlamydiaceae bacterium]